MLQPGRVFNTSGYRYGFNGKENDNEVKGEGNGGFLLTRRVFQGPKTTVLKTEQNVTTVTKTTVKTAAANSGVLTIPQGLTAEMFQKMSQLLRSKVGNITGDIVVQGSRAAGTATAISDIDIALKLNSTGFSKMLGARFKNVNVGSAKEKTFIHAFQTGKIQAGEAGLSSLRKELQELLGMDVHISIIKEGGPFDNGAQLPINKVTSN
jgi:hypothetical protein